MRNMSEFDENLRELMIENNLTLSTLSQRSQVAKSAISVYLNGASYPTPKNLIKLANAFNCSVDYLLGRKNKNLGFYRVKINKSFYEIVNDLFQENKINANSLSKNIGIGRATITDWKKGHSPSYESLILLADYFCVSVDYLLGLTDKK